MPKKLRDKVNRVIRIASNRAIQADIEGDYVEQKEQEEFDRIIRIRAEQASVEKNLINKNYKMDNMAQRKQGKTRRIHKFYETRKKKARKKKGYGKRKGGKRKENGKGKTGKRKGKTGKGKRAVPATTLSAPYTGCNVKRIE
ncbi:dynein regulatory complex protein 10-like [Centruroides vittatus]|uniref:dynein regulatory complex protein 10-like n=1 Tax=Centruroides vittatus TaxID=120091 RepID=UPI00350F4C3F